MSKPIDLKVASLMERGIGAKHIGDTLYIWSWVPRTRVDGRVRCVVLHNNPTYRRIHEAVRRMGIPGAQP